MRTHLLLVDRASFGFDLQRMLNSLPSWCSCSSTCHPFSWYAWGRDSIKSCLHKIRATLLDGRQPMQRHTCTKEFVNTSNIVQITRMWYLHTLPLVSNGKMQYGYTRMSYRISSVAWFVHSTVSKTFQIHTSHGILRCNLWHVFYIMFGYKTNTLTMQLSSP